MKVIQAPMALTRKIALVAVMLSREEGVTVEVHSGNLDPRNGTTALLGRLFDLARSLDKKLDDRGYVPASLDPRKP